MKLSYSWLKEYVKTKLTAEEIAEKLTMAGLEVDEVVSGVNYSGVVVGRVESIDKHPNADKLRVAQVRVTSPVTLSGTKGLGPEIMDSSYGQNDEGILQIVCGATNLAEGQIVPVAVVGAKLGDFEIGKASLRGVESHGMICSEKELGIGEDHSGIMVLEKGFKIGESFISSKGADSVIDVSVLANRPDCMSIIGLAREVSALTGEKLVLKNPKIKETKSEDNIKVRVEDSVLCPRYMSRIVGDVQLNETPGWMKERLDSCGVRSIDLLVDISNYVMLEYGQPLHFFDLDKLKSKQNHDVILSKTKDPGLDSSCGQNDGEVEIIVRSAKDGETITTLDGNKRKLTKDNLVIANSKEPIAIAGVMGGATTEISKDTKNIFIEAAVFDKASIRKTSRALGLRSEAVARFEKGLAITAPELALDRAAELLADLAGGKVSEHKTDTLTSKIKPKVVALNPSKLNTFLGTRFTDAQIKNTLSGLGFVVNVRTKYHFEVSVPMWRVDIDEAVDLYEEVARIIGFEHIPSTLPFGVKSSPKVNKFYEFMKKTRNELASIGLTEIMTYSFASEEEILSIGADPKKASLLANPLVKEQKYMRVSLIPKMLESLASNQYHRDSISFFEIGKTFHRSSSVIPAKARIQKETGVLAGGSQIEFGMTSSVDGVSSLPPCEDTLLSIGVIGGTTWPFGYKEGREYYQIKGILEHISSVLLNKKVVFKASENLEFETGRRADIIVDKVKIGSIGEVQSNIARKFGLKKVVAIAVLDLEKAMSLGGNEEIYHEISKYQQSVRDISFVVPRVIEGETILSALKGSDKLLLNTEILDIYEGKTLASDEKSITVRLTIGSFDHTLAEEEVEKVVNICQNNVEKVGGKVRGSAK